MPKHSPGPWFFDPTDGTIWFNDADPITLFEQVDGDDMGDPETLTADGRLAASAPELIAALRTSDRAHAAFIHWAINLPPHLAPPKKLVDAARTASREIEASIDKAEGSE